MWLLENDGDVFHGKRLWLRPGKKFIFGRTSAEAGGFVVENKTISRKHLIIEVEAVKSGDCIKLNTRSRIILEDLNTKIGTLVNGNQIRGQRHDLISDSYEIKLGQYDKLFRIFWNPMVLSLSFNIKELKVDPLQSFYEKLEGLDIKVLVDYVRESTTHVVSKKRNTSKGLQALINGKYIVDHTFIDAIVTASQAEEEKPSPLESDFDSNWPKELQYLPPRGAEPTQRSSDTYAPNPNRQEIFEGYVFVLCDQSQFENLLAPIIDGRGKALLYQVEPFKTEIEDFIRYVKNVAGEKGLGEFEDGSEGKGVIIVRCQPAKGPTLDWYADFGRRVALHLDHRLIDQREFLDAILNNDASVLRKPLELEESCAMPPPQTAASSTKTPISNTTVEGTTVNHIAEGSTSAAAPPTRRMGRSRRIVTSRFKGFDDDFDTPLIPESTPARNMELAQLESQDVGLFISQPQNMDVDHPYPNVNPIQTRSSRKRLSPPPAVEEDEQDMLDQLVPAATSLKRRRLANEIAARQSGGTVAPPLPSVTEQKAETLSTKRKKVKPEVDVLEVARQQREKEEAIARAEREALQEAMDGMDIDQIRNLAIIEEVEVKRTVPPMRAGARRDESGRWDERWNGRKNFKQFRRRGEDTSRAINKVIVPLEEVKKKDFGIGDEYWLEGEKDDNRKKRGKGRAKETQPVDDTQSPTVTTGGQVDEAVIVDECGISDPPVLSQTIPKTRSQRLSDKTNVPLGRLAPNKRAAGPLAKSAPAKKVRQSTLRQDSDDSEDGLGFRFRKK